MSMAQWIEKAKEAHRKAIEQLYEDTCTIYEEQEVTDEETNITSMETVAVLENQPCKLSFENLSTTSEDGNATEKKIAVKLFLAPEIGVKAGSQIEVTHNGETAKYSNSGEAGKFFTHQEINLELAERWA